MNCRLLYVKRSAPIFYQVLDATTLISGSFYCRFQYVLQVGHFCTNCFISAVIFGQNTAYLALLTHPLIPVWPSWICCKVLFRRASGTIILSFLRSIPSLIVISCLYSQYYLISVRTFVLSSGHLCISCSISIFKVLSVAVIFLMSSRYVFAAEMSSS